MRASATFKKRTYICVKCAKEIQRFLWSYDAMPKHCGFHMEPEHMATAKSATVIGDEIDVVVTDGPCNPDGTPRRYRSRSELARETAALGWQREGDTPHPERTDLERR